MVYTPTDPTSDAVKKIKQLQSYAMSDLPAPPQVDAENYLCNGELLKWDGGMEDVYSCVCFNDGTEQRVKLGTIHYIDTKTSLSLLDAAYNAFNLGRGQWPRSTVAERITATEKFVEEMIKVREEVVVSLMWEIGKNRKDSENEFDRTVTYIKETLQAVSKRNNSDATFLTASDHVAQVRRSPLGVVLSMGPFNYPLNETFTTLLPAVIMGNTCVVKLPRHGALCIYPMMKAFATCFPAGVVNIFNGKGSQTAGPIIETGKLSSLAFIGSSTAANRLRIQHPKPSRMRCTLGLDAKNAAIVLKDADLDVAVKQVVAGTLAFGGQRCTGIKIVFVAKEVIEPFLAKFNAAVDAISIGLPWDQGVGLCALPEFNKVDTLQQYVDDAIEKGASVVNRNGGLTTQTFYFPSVVYPVKPGMRLYTEEQFGPVVPVADFSDVETVISYLAESTYGQQVSIFGEDPHIIGPLCDILIHQVCRVNLNGPCKRGPDVFPFTARKDSAEGTLDIESAIRAFSIRTMVAGPITEMNRTLISSIIAQRTSQFLNNDVLF